MVLVFFNDTATTEIYTLSLHDALPIFSGAGMPDGIGIWWSGPGSWRWKLACRLKIGRPCWMATTRRVAELLPSRVRRSGEHTSELQSRQYLVCRLLLDKKYTTGIDKPN